MLPARAVPGGILLQLRLTPRGGRDAIDGVMTDAAGEPWLKARVSAAAESNKANEAVLRLLAEALGAPRRDLVIEAGHTARTKRIRVAGESGPLLARLRALIGPPAPA
jgi:uncharacterized protein YggU (UPF0235/DUF167 family)